jgi:hypothetical protein
VCVCVLESRLSMIDLCVCVCVLESRLSMIDHRGLVISVL